MAAKKIKIKGLTYILESEVEARLKRYKAQIKNLKAKSDAYSKRFNDEQWEKETTKRWT